MTFIFLSANNAIIVKTATLWYIHTGIRGFFLNVMRYINPRFTYLLTYLLTLLSAMFVYFQHWKFSFWMHRERKSGVRNQS